ncbi:polyketide synthase [Apiospora marii]|uniref:Polyketide synthase n=1 Tax=Apiospora marii TaxID=335849 RepID=A0ABR1T0X0_9PEZI
MCTTLELLSLERSIGSAVLVPPVVREGPASRTTGTKLNGATPTATAPASAASPPTTLQCQLLVYSARDEAGLKRILQQYSKYYDEQIFGSPKRIKSGDNINLPELSQPLCTALQIALVELLRNFRVAPVAVIGHSSGEIAAASAFGALSLESACRVAYHWGRLCGKLASSSKPTAMMSVNLEEADFQAYVEKAFSDAPDVHVACVNSPSNITVAGSEPDIDMFKAHQQMALMVSSVNGQPVSPSTLSSARYSVDNMTSPVRSADAFQYLTQAAPKLDGIKAITHCRLWLF